METNHMIDSENALIDRPFLSTKEGTQTKVIKYIHQDQRHLHIRDIKKCRWLFFFKPKD